MEDRKPLPALRASAIWVAATWAGRNLPASLMPDRPTALERAFALAQSGKVSSIVEIRQILTRERLDARQIEGRLLKLQLRQMIDKSIISQFEK